MKLYGLGRRGIAIYPPDKLPDAFAPIPLFENRAAVEAMIEEMERKRGVGAWHVIEYEVTRT